MYFFIKIWPLRLFFFWLAHIRDLFSRRFFLLNTVLMQSYFLLLPIFQLLSLLLIKFLHINFLEDVSWFPQSYLNVILIMLVVVIYFEFNNFRVFSHWLRCLLLGLFDQQFDLICRVESNSAKILGGCMMIRFLENMNIISISAFHIKSLMEESSDRCFSLMHGTSLNDKGQVPVKSILKKRHFMRINGDSSHLHKNDVYEDDVKEPSFQMQSSYHHDIRSISHQQLPASAAIVLSKEYLKSQPHSNSASQSYKGDSPKRPLIEYDKIVEESVPRVNSRRSKTTHPVLEQDYDDEKIAFEHTNGSLNIAWKNKALWIIFHITRFSKQLKTHASKFKFRLLTRSIIQLIGDQAADEEEIMILKRLHNKEANEYDEFQNSLSLQLHEVLQKAQRFSQKIPVFEPDSLFKLIWDTTIVILIIMNIFFIPMKLSFGFDSTDYWQAQLLLQTIPSWFFIIDIIFNFNTAYYKNGMIHTKRQDIIHHYLQGSLRYDLITVLPFIISQFQIPFTEYTLLLRQFRVKHMLEKLEEMLNFKDSIQAIFDLIKQVFFLMFVAHITACAWHFLGEFLAQNEQRSWLIVYKTYGQPWQIRYLQSVYFSIITTLTIGYGDLVPQTDAERLFVIVVALFICGVFGYTISSIGEIFKNIQEKRQKFKTQMKYINQYLKSKALNKQLQFKVQIKIRKYFEYYFRIEQSRNIEGERLINQLTKKLKEELHIDLYQHILRKSRVIKQNLSQKTVQQLCSCVKEITYAPEEDIFNKGEQAMRLIYVIRGSVLVLTEKPEHVLKRFVGGQFIGEREFAIGDSYSYNARAEKFTTVAYINYDEFMKVIQEDTKDLHSICMMKDRLLLDPTYRNFGQVCEICQWTHAFTKCPFVFHQPNTARIAKLFQSNEDMPRQLQVRRNRGTHAYISMNNIQECSLAYIINNEIMNQMELTDNYLLQLGFKLDESLNMSNQNDTGKNMSTRIINKTTSPQRREVVTSIIENNLSYSRQASEQQADKVETAQQTYDNNGYPFYEGTPQSSRAGRPETEDLSPRKRFFLKTDAISKGEIQVQSSSVGFSSFASSSNHKAVKFTVQPTPSSMMVVERTENKHRSQPAQLRRGSQQSELEFSHLHSNNNPRLSFKDIVQRRTFNTLQRMSIRKGGELQRRGHIPEPDVKGVNSRFSFKEETARKNSTHNYLDLEMPSRNNIRKASENTQVTALRSSTVKHSLQVFDEGEHMTQLLRVRVDFDLDRFLADSSHYFPNGDITVILKKLWTHKQQHSVMFKKKKTNLPFFKLRSATIRPINIKEG